jgi:hypothetical protein
LLPHVAGWRWLHGSTECAWYQSIRLFRQSKLGRWDNVLAAVRRAVEAEILN